MGKLYASSAARIPGTRVVSVVSRSLAGATALAEQAGAGQVGVYDELAACLANPAVDLVCISSPNHLHAAHAIAAARAGKAVLIEKPLCLSVREAEAIAAAREASGTFMGYAENLCYAPLFRQVRARVAEGAIGDVRAATHVYKHSGPHSDWFFERETAGGGALMDMGCHGIALLRWLLGRPEVSDVWAALATRLHSGRTDLDDDAVVRMRLAGGGEAVSESSWALAGGFQNSLRLEGSRAILELDAVRGTLVIDGQPQPLYMPADPLVGGGYVAQLEHALSCMQDGTQPEQTLEDGVQVLQLLLAAYAAARTGGSIKLPFEPRDVDYPVDLWTELGGRS
jgi:predicted dehydrogenase